MSNVKFLYEGCDLATFVASAGTNSLSDINNLADRNPNTRWISNGVTNGQTLTITLPAARTANTFLIDGHNMSLIASETLGLILYYSTNGSAWTQIERKESADLTPVIYEFTSVVARYWKLEFSNAGIALLVPPEIGNIFVGTRFEPAYPYNPEVDRSGKYSTVFSRSLDATPYASQKLSDGIEAWKSLKWTDSSDAIANGFIALNNSVRGRLRPFYFIDTNDVVKLVLLSADGVSIKTKRYNINDIQVELEAYLTNTMTAI